MRFTMEEIVNLAAEAIGACFFIALFWSFVTGGMTYSLGALIRQWMSVLGG